MRVATSTPPRHTTMKMLSVRRLSRTSLKVRYRRVETIRSESTATTMAMGTRAPVPSGSPPRIPWWAMTIETIIPAASGMGRPTKNRLLPEWSDEWARTLNRARRSAPQAVYMNETRRPTTPSDDSAHLYTSIAGTTPKEMTSARLSSSTPNWLWVRVRRATRPSNPSKNIAKKMARAAWYSWEG